MLELPKGLIKMTEDETECYLHFSGRTCVPKTKIEFNTSLIQAASDMRARIASGHPRRWDNEVRAEMIEDFLADPHAAHSASRHQAWIDAGCPWGEDDMRKAGLSSPALDRLQREREALKKADESLRSVGFVMV